MVKFLADDPLAVTVGEEIDRSSRDYADEIRAQPFEEGAPSFKAVDGKEYLKGFVEVEEGASRKGKRSWRRDMFGRTGGLDLRLIEVRLQSSFEDIKGRSEDGGGHASKAVDF